MGSLCDDPRWRRLNDFETPCPCCGMRFTGLPDIGYSAPSYWTGDPTPSDTFDSDANPLLTHDTCVDDEDRFVRCVLELPLVGGAGETFGLGVWASLSQSSFDLYVKTFGSDQSTTLAPCFGWLSNVLPTFPDTLALPCTVTPRGEGKRPSIWLNKGDHPLVAAQREGISLDRALEIIAAAAGADLRPHLAAPGAPGLRILTPSEHPSKPPSNRR